VAFFFVAFFFVAFFFVAFFFVAFFLVALFFVALFFVALFFVTFFFVALFFVAFFFVAFFFAVAISLSLLSRLHGLRIVPVRTKQPLPPEQGCEAKIYEEPAGAGRNSVSWFAFLKRNP